MTTYKNVTTQLIMNDCQYQWLMQHLNRLRDCANLICKRLLNDSQLKPTAACYKTFYQYFLYEASIYRLNEQEKKCLQHYVEALWSAYEKAMPLPKLVYRNLLRNDFTYHKVDMSTFIDSSLFIREYRLKASTIYQYRKQWYIYLYVKELENSLNVSD